MTTPLIPLNILIGDRSYRIKILPEDEETVRATLKIINEKILDFRSQYAGKDMQDYISMVLIWYATQPRPTDASGIQQRGLQEILTKMEGQIDNVIQSS
ncbi:MAG: cell division protein ZapA [Ginsengibacter sp.]